MNRNGLTRRMLSVGREHDSVQKQAIRGGLR
jgi:hypothetical protein